VKESLIQKDDNLNSALSMFNSNIKGEREMPFLKNSAFKIENKERQETKSIQDSHEGIMITNKNLFFAEKCQKSKRHNSISYPA
jgi:hypothetical protein